MPLREWQKNLLVMTGAAAFVLGGTEIVLRGVWHPANEAPVIRSHPVYGWELRPGARLHSIQSAAGFDYEIRINALGMRDREHTLAKRPGVARVLFLGDSMLFGPGVAIQERCTERLERALAPDVEVWNGAVSGWGPDQEYLRLCTEGWRAHPDVVVVGLCVMNDVVNVMLDHELFGAAPKPRFTLQDGRLVVVPPPRRAAGHPSALQLLKRSRLLHFVGRRVRAARAARARPTGTPAAQPHGHHASDESHWAVYRRDPSPRLAAAFEVTEALLAAMQDSCAAHRVQFVVCVVPQRIEVDEAARRHEMRRAGADPAEFDFAAPYDRLRRFALAHHMTWIDPHPAFADENPDRFYFEHDAHLSAAGHARLATELLPALRAVLPPRPAPVVHRG